MARDLERVAERLREMGFDVKQADGWLIAAHADVRVSCVAGYSLKIDGRYEEDVRDDARESMRRLAILDAIDGKPAPETPEAILARGVAQGRAAALKEAAGECDVASDSADTVDMCTALRDMRDHLLGMHTDAADAAEVLS